MVPYCPFIDWGSRAVTGGLWLKQGEGKEELRSERERKKVLQFQGHFLLGFWGKMEVGRKVIKIEKPTVKISLLTVFIAS